jgi:OOP family OmpA-OmpF porin
VGCKVDKTGCPGDQDGDGVCDGVDQCPDTPKGATVDSLGCPHDADRDSVPDGIDQCPDTPAGAKVDGKGCPIDTDGDGVPDGIDQCPDTPAGVSVDAKGCLTDVSKREMELTDTGMMRVSRVDFTDGPSSIPDATRGQLEAVGAVLVKWPTLKIEIGAHTDSKSSASASKKLSDSRAKAVLAYLLQRYPALDKKQFTTKAYGATRPIADNGTSTGRATNNRIELVVLNKGELVKQVQSRQAKPAPGDTKK